MVGRETEVLCLLSRCLVAGVMVVAVRLLEVAWRDVSQVVTEQCMSEKSDVHTSLEVLLYLRNLDPAITVAEGPSHTW
jgi:hypothetical protein